MSYPVIELRGAVVAITGAARGIGFATAEAFLAKGAVVVLFDRDASVHKAAADLGCTGLVADVTDRADLEAAVQAVLDAHGGIDVWVNNAGVMPVAAFLDESDATSATTLDVNVWGLIHGMRLVLPHMVAARRGHVVNVASMAGKLAVPGLAVYNASKFAAVGLTAAVRAEMEPHGVSVSAVLPSAVRTGLTSGIRLGHGMPTVDPSDVAAAIVGSVGNRHAEIPVPRYVGLVGTALPLVPGPLTRLAYRLLDGNRALTSVDEAARGDYERRVAEQVRSR
jgi:NADP-dependent 3-hydroxy acid dehydrogenase YdfG